MNQHFNEWSPETNANENVEGHSDKLENIVRYVSCDSESNMHYGFQKY